MDYKEKLKQIVEYFGLEYKGRFIYMECTHREVTLHNFLSGCPVPQYANHGSMKDDREKYLQDFMNSEDSKYDHRGTTGTVISRKGLNQAIIRVKNLDSSELREELLDIYRRIAEKMGEGVNLVLVATDKKTVPEDLLLHEFVHELNNENNLRINEWKWNEGLVTYMAHYGLGDYHLFATDTSGFLDSREYIEYGKKWHELFSKTNSPLERRQLIQSIIDSKNFSS